MWRVCRVTPVVISKEEEIEKEVLANEIIQKYREES